LTTPPANLRLPLLLTTPTEPTSSPWTPLPYGDVARFDAGNLHLHWARLHAGQDIPPPPPGPLAEGWALYHSGDFERAVALGLEHGPEGHALANQATAVYANYVEPREGVRLVLFREVADRAAVQLATDPGNCQALYWQAYALSRYSQGISVARALAQGLGSRIKHTLERVIELQPGHADAHFALAAFHTEVIDKVGALVARMTYSVRADAAVELFERGLQLHPGSASGLMDYARGLLMLYGDSRMAEATRFYEMAASLQPTDARERLDVELARAGLAD
jgi:tetratricopeptide (TPR) repeat protein